MAAVVTPPAPLAANYGTFEQQFLVKALALHQAQTQDPRTFIDVFGRWFFACLTNLFVCSMDFSFVLFFSCLFLLHIHGRFQFHAKRCLSRAIPMVFWGISYCTVDTQISVSS